MGKIVERNNKCTHCGGTLEKNEIGVYVCPFCGSEFEIAGEEPKAPEPKEKETEKKPEKETKSKPAKESKTEKGNEFSKTEWFDYQEEYKNLITGSESRATLNSFVHCVNDIGNADEILKYMKQRLNSDGDLCMAGVNEKAMNNFAKRMKQFLSKDEELILYANSGIFSKGKHGMLLTNKQIITSGLKAKHITYDELFMIKMDMGSDIALLYLNGTIGFPTLTSKKTLGALAALIAALAFKYNPNHDLIAITGGRDDDDDDEDDEDYEDYDEDDDDDDDDGGSILGLVGEILGDNDD